MAVTIGNDIVDVYRTFRSSLAIALLVAVASMLAGCGGGGGAEQSMSAGPSAALAWDASPSPNVAGYRIYYGTAPGTYSQPLGQGMNVGSATAFTVTGLSSRTTYYFATTAIDTSGGESDYSNEVSKTIP